MKPGEHSSIRQRRLSRIKTNRIPFGGRSYLDLGFTALCTLSVAIMERIHSVILEREK